MSLKRQVERNQKHNESKATEQPNKMISGGIRELRLNKSFNRLTFEGDKIKRDFNLQGVKFVMCDKTSIVSNHDPVGSYIHLDDIFRFLAQNCNGVAQPQGKIITPQKKLFIP